MSCGRPTNGGYVVGGAPLKCGMHLYWKVKGERNVSEMEIVLCDDCTTLQETLGGKSNES
jgi:hypothetical protein